MGEMRGRVAALAALALAAVAIGAVMGRGPTTQSSSATGHQPHVTTTAVDTVAVHVSGMVLSPGVVDVPTGALVADAIAAAGGLLAGALVEELNLAAPVSPGEQIVVPGPAGSDDASAAAPTDGIISINQASATELENLPGVGPVLAERIVAHREANGRFSVVEDLLEVPGIGEAKLDAIRELVKP